MNELINVTLNENQEPVVSGRQLHKALEVKTAYKDWFPRMVGYGFTENEDFCSNLSESTGGRRATDHVLKLDMAKEIAMIQRTDKGKEVRQYFIQVEKEYNNPVNMMARSLKYADNQMKLMSGQIKHLEEKLEKQEPHVIFSKAVSAGQTTILVGDLAKLIGQNGVKIGQNRLFQWMRDNGYLISRKGSSFNMPTQKAMDLGLFKVKETAITHADGHTTVNKTPKVTGKGQNFFINKFLSEMK